MVTNNYVCGIYRIKYSWIFKLEKMTKEDKERMERAVEREKFLSNPIGERVLRKFISSVAGTSSPLIEEEWAVGASKFWNFINTPREAICERWDPTTCPTCEEAFDEECNDGYYENSYLDKCPYCGQKIEYK